MNEIQPGKKNIIDYDARQASPGDRRGHRGPLQDQAQRRQGPGGIVLLSDRAERGEVPAQGANHTRQRGLSVFFSMMSSFFFLPAVETFFFFSSPGPPRVYRCVRRFKDHFD